MKNVEMFIVSALSNMGTKSRISQSRNATILQDWFACALSCSNM